MCTSMAVASVSLVGVRNLDPRLDILVLANRNRTTNIQKTFFPSDRYGIVNCLLSLTYKLILFPFSEFVSKFISLNPGMAWPGTHTSLA